MKLLEFNMADMSAEVLILQAPPPIRRGGRGGGLTAGQTIMVDELTVERDVPKDYRSTMSR